MHILCPHCRNPIEIVKLTPHEEIACPSCGSSFRLETESTTGWQPGSDKLGKFELIEVVGQGAFGTVYKAHDSELDRTVAVKVPRAGNLAGPQELDRFLREARSVAQLRHPAIVSIHEVGQKDGVSYLVSDFVQGVTLADLLSARRPGFRETAELIAAVADALQYAHEKGVIHRDVKPSNIMIGDDGRPCVMDFGLAKRDAGEITMTVEGQVLGTPAYMSPEQAGGEAHGVDGRSDVYSLGVILYQMLTGELPFRGTKRMLLHQVLHDEPKPPRRLNDRIPRDLETSCLKAMAKEPSRRYATAVELADDLRRWLKGEAIRARPVGHGERAWRWCRRNPVVASLAAVVGALLVAVTLVSSFAAIRISAALDTERAALSEAENKRQDAENARERERLALLETESRRKEAENARRELVGALTTIWDHRARLLKAIGDNRGKGVPVLALNKLLDSMALVGPIRVSHFAKVGNFEQPRGELGIKSFSVRSDDSVTVKVKVGWPAYCYLVAFRPDGTEEVCYPEDERMAPPRSDELGSAVIGYPGPRSPGYRYGLNEGSGLHVFVLAASLEPLPPYAEWRKQREKSPWRRVPALPDVVWRFDGLDMRAVTPDDPDDAREAGRQAKGLEPLIELTTWLRQEPRFVSLAAVAFPVLPAK